MAERIGIQVGPDVFEMLFRMGAKITGDGEDISICLIENGVPKNLVMTDYGFNRREGQFFFVFGEKGDQSPGSINWRAPVYEKEVGHEADS